MIRRHGNTFFTNKKKVKKRDFLTKKFKNPYFLKERMPRRTKAPKLKIGLGIACLTAIVGIFLLHPFFLINNIKISGNRTIPTEEILNKVNQVISKKRFLLLDGRNIFAVDTDQIKKDLEGTFIFQALNISTDFPHSLNIDVKEKGSAAVLFIPDSVSSSTLKYFILDNTGKIIRQSDEIEVNTKLNKLPKITIENSNKQFNLNEQILDPANYEFIKFLSDSISNINNLTVNYYSLPTITDKTVNVITGEGWKIIVDRQNDWKKQMQVLETILKDKIKDRKNLKYVDVRFENRSYFQ